MFEYSEGARRDAERSRQRWAALTDREKRQGRIFCAVCFAIAIALVVIDGRGGIF